MTKRLPGRLNVFQLTMLEWREQHPYTAVHAVRVPDLVNPGALAAAIDAERSQLGLGQLELDRRHRRYAWREDPSATPVAWINGVDPIDEDGRARSEAVASGDPRTADRSPDAHPDRAHGRLEREIERQMNTPFAREGALDPFRFFAMPCDRGGFLGLAYDHFIAGGDSIVWLMNRIVARLAGEPQPEERAVRYPPAQWPLLLRHPLRVARAVTSMPSMASSCRRTLRPRYGDISDGRNGFALYRLDSAGLEALRCCARRWDVTFNDLLLALLLLARDPPTRARLGAARRRELAAASIMNLREHHGEHGRDVFGQFLGSLRVSHPVAPGVALETLARDVHRDTVRFKREHLYLAGLVAMRADRLIGRFQTPQQRMGVYMKGYPVNAATSTLNVDALWRRPPDGASSSRAAFDGTPPAVTSPDGESPGSAPACATPEYLRGVPTGPLAPLVVAATTAGGEVRAGISYRTSAMSRIEIDAMWADMLGRIRTLQ